jgi:hypothetical protein
VPVLVWALTCPGSTAPRVVSGVVAVVPKVPVAGSAVSGVGEGSTGAVSTGDVSTVDVSVVVESVEGVDESVVSAAATPWPIAIAVPTPNATASPPTRPI